MAVVNPPPPPVRQPAPAPRIQAPAATRGGSRGVEAYVAARQAGVDREWTRRRDAAIAQTARRLGIRNGPPYNATDLFLIMEDAGTREQFAESNRWRTSEMRRLTREGSEHGGGPG
jgi:hypothetical protein